MCACVSVCVDGFMTCAVNVRYMILSNLLNELRCMIVAAVVVSVSLACLVWIQLAHSVAILIFHSESMRVWVCVTSSNGISILPGPWTVALCLRQIHIVTHLNITTLHYTNLPLLVLEQTMRGCRHRAYGRGSGYNWKLTTLMWIYNVSQSLWSLRLKGCSEKANLGLHICGSNWLTTQLKLSAQETCFFHQVSVEMEVH